MPFGFNFSAAKNLVSGAVNVAAKAAEQAAAVAETAASAAVETASAAASAVVDVAPAPEAAPAPVQQPAAPNQVPQQAAGPRPAAARPVAPRQVAPAQVRPSAPVQRTPQQPAPLQPRTPQQFPPVRSGPPTPLPGSPGGLRSPRPGGPNGARPRGPPFGPGSPRGLPGGPRMVRGPRPPGQLGSPRTPGGTPIRAVRPGGPGGPSGPPQSLGMQRPRAPFNSGAAGQEQNSSNPQVDLTQLNQQERQHIEQVMNKAAQDTLQPQGYNQIDQNQFNADPNQQMPGQNQPLTNQDQSMMRQNPPMNQDQCMMNQDPSMMNQGNNMMNQSSLMMNQNNSMNNQDPSMMNQGSHMMNQDPSMMNQGSHMMNQDPSMMNQGSHMMNQDPPMMDQGHNMMNQDPLLMDQGNNMLNQDPSMMNQGPPMMNQGNNMMNQGNNMMNQGNNMMNQDPAIMNQRNSMMNPNQPMMDPEPMMDPPMNGPNPSMMIDQNQAMHQSQLMMGQPLDIDQNGGMMGPEQNFMNNNMVHGQYNGPSSQDPQFSREHGPNGFLSNGSVPFGPLGDCQQRLGPETCDNPYGSDSNLDNECMDGPGGLGNTRGVQGLKRPDQLIPLNSQLKPKQMKDEDKPESHPNLPNKASSNEAKSVMKTHVTKPVEKMESPVTTKMGGNGVAQPFVGNGPVNLQMTNSHELGKDIAIPTTSSYPSKQQQNIILNQLAKQSSQREYTKSEDEEQNHIVKDRIRSYENTTHSGGLVINLKNGIQQSPQQPLITNVNEMSSKQPINQSKTKIIRQSELVSTGTSPVLEDVPLNKTRPKTRIIYDMGTPEMCSQGINASIPVTTDKYTYTITSVLTATGLNNPPTTQTSTSKGSKPSVRSTETGFRMMPSDEFNSLFNNQCNRNPSYNSDLDSPPLYLNQRECGIGVMSPPLPSTHQVYLNNSENYERHTKSDCKHSNKQGPPVRGASSQPGRPGTADGALSPIPDVSPSLEAAESLGFNDRGRDRGRSYEEHRGRGQDDRSQDESISGVLNNFSKALGDIREIREKRMQSLGPLVKQSEDSKKSMNGQNQFQQNQHHNQQQQQMQRYPQQNQQQPYNNQQRQQQQQYGQNKQQQQPQYGQQQQNYRQQQNFQQSGFQQQQQQQMQPPPPAGTILQQPQQQVQQVPQTSGIVLAQQPVQQQQQLVQQQPGVHMMQVPQQTGQPIVIYSSAELTAPTPALISAPTPLPLVVNSSIPMSSAAYTFDPSGLSASQQLALIQSQQQHQQQHLKKMRQRLPHGKSGSPGKKFDPLPTAALLQSSTLVATPDTLSESGSIKSARSRSRTLPFLPPEEPAPLPSQAKKAQDRMRSYGKIRQSSLDGITGMPPKSYSSFGRPRPSNSETNLRKLALEERNRPVSALGLLQASSVISSHGPSQAAKEHEKRILENILPPDLRHLIRGGGGSSYSFQNIRQQIENDLKGGVSSNNSGPSAGEIARLNAEKKLFGVQSERIRAEMQRYAATKDPRLRAEMKHKLNPVMDNQLSRTRRMRGHRRNLSDGRITTSLTDTMGDDTGFSSLPNRPFSSLSGGHLDSYDYGTDNSQSYLFEGLRESSVAGYGLTEEDKIRAYNNPRMMQRRSSLGGGGGIDSALYDYGNNPVINTMNRRPHSSMSGKLGQGSLGPGARSWHPSPLHSDEETEEHQFFKEEKKNRIKMEISRRRNQIEENARLHEELIRLAKLRETAELGGGEINRLHVTGYNNSPNISPGRDGTGVLRSVDEILRNDHQNFSSYGSSSARMQTGRRDLGRHGYEDDLLVSGPGMGMDRYNAPVYDSTRKPQRLTDFSPVNSDLADFNHHYSDSGRSRKFDEYGNFNSSSSNYNAGMGNLHTGSNNFNPGMSFNSNGRYGRHNLYR